MPGQQTFPGVSTLIPLRRFYPAILALGSQRKNTVCALKGHTALVTPPVNDLEDASDYTRFEEHILKAIDWLELPPAVIAYDLHPDYISSKIKDELCLRWSGARCAGVQHHHAHLASVLAERGHAGDAIGIAFDGTGYGVDGTLWGGEILTIRGHGFTRAAWFAPIRLPGGVRAIREPWLIGLSLLQRTFGRGLFDLPLPMLERHTRGDIDLALRMMERAINAPLTSGCGRLFDGVSALLGVRDRVRFEGEAAMELERLLPDDWRSGDCYPFDADETPGGVIIESAPMIHALVVDIAAGIPAGVCAAKFHNGIVRAVVSVVLRLREATGIRTIVMAGGCFLNRHLSEGIEDALERAGCTVLLPEQLPVGDAGISLGQAIVAAEEMTSEGVSC